MPTHFQHICRGLSSLTHKNFTKKERILHTYYFFVGYSWALRNSLKYKISEVLK